MFPTFIYSVKLCSLNSLAKSQRAATARGVKMMFNTPGISTGGGLSCCNSIHRVPWEMFLAVTDSIKAVLSRHHSHEALQMEELSWITKSVLNSSKNSNLIRHSWTEIKLSIINHHFFFFFKLKSYWYFNPRIHKEGQIDPACCDLWNILSMETFMYLIFH